MNIEGTNGRGRGEDQVWPGHTFFSAHSLFTCRAQDFERKSALSSLPSSKILIVKLWEHQVGLYQGAGLNAVDE